MLRVIATPCAREYNVLITHIQALRFKTQMNAVKLIENAHEKRLQRIQMKCGYCAVSSSVRLCWSCNHPVHNHEYFCECGKIQPVDKNMSYFDAFGYVKPVVQMDTIDLARRMRDIQKRLHPDKFSRASPYEQKLAADAATFINQAYATLHKHIGRFSYILSLHGFNREDSPPSGSVNSEFLNEIMDLSEKLQEIVIFLEIPHISEDALSELRESLKNLIDRITRSLNSEHQILVDCLEQTKLDDAQSSLIRYRYYLRLLQQLSEHELAWKKLGIHIDIPSF
ncbi:molecular chaperone HscB [Paragonimus westermani]|uniref:Molecular chaperone HscB n=1 Tax=Paragonimus westermani TaxID=34504 RepID=A0A5J4N2V4_9TREM|nr:molecular chaperone HscB [Paragonimus westermani]